MSQLAPKDQLEFAPAYFQGQFFKLVPESSTSLFTEADRIAIADAIRINSAAPTADINELLAKTGEIYDLDDNAFREAVGKILKNNTAPGNEGKFARIEGALSQYYNRILAPEESDNIGGYINKLMVLGSTMEQQDDILRTLDQAGGIQAQVADIIREQTLTGLLSPSDAVDAAVQAGGLSIKGLDMAQPAVRDAFVQGTAAALEAIQQTADVDQIAAALDALNIGSLDDAGAHVLTQVGRRMGMQRAAAAALDLVDMEKLGIDSALFDLKIATNKEAQDLILAGMQEGANKLAEQTIFTSDQIAKIEDVRKGFEEKGIAGLRGEIVLAGDSKYRSASILISAAESSNAFVTSSSRELYKSLNSTEIDSFYYARQNDIMPRQLEESGNELVTEFLHDARGLDAIRKDSGYQATQETKTKEEVHLRLMGEKYEQLIKDETERLRSEGFTNIDELDIADAVERSQRSMKSSEHRMSKLMSTDTQERPYLESLFNRAQVRRDYSMITSSSGFESSDTYKLSQVMDRALSMTTPTHRAKLEESFDHTPDLQKFLIGLADKPSGKKGGTLKGPAAIGVGLDELVDGIMSPDEYRSITGLLKQGTQEGPIDDLVARDISAVTATLGELRTLAEARKLGFEARYADTATGKVTIPKLINALTGGSGASTTPVSGPGYKRITELFKDGTIKNLMDKPYIKSAAIGTAALAVFGFVYSAHKDKSIEDMQGPPLLPGGSAYESAYPGNTLNMPPPQNLLPSGQNGVTYRVNASGSYADAQKFSEAAGGLSSDSSTSYYGGARDASANPYSEIVSSF